MMDIELVKETGIDVVVSNPPNNEESQAEMNSLLQLAVSKDLDTEKLSKLIDLKNKEEERACKKEFDFHFARMQKNLLPIKKTKDGNKTTSGVVTFKYAPVEDCQRINGPIIAEYGFSNTWTEENLENGFKRVRIHISGYGHTDSKTYFDVPPLEPNKIQSAIQAEGVRKGYGKRYTYVEGYGMTVEGEDNVDSLTFEDGVKYGEYQTLFETCGNMEELKEAYHQEYENLGNDMEGKKVLAMLKDKRKRELSK